MATKKVTTKKKIAAKKKTSIAPGKEILYLHSMKASKAWLKKLAKKKEKSEGGNISISTMAERVFHTAMKLPEFRI